MKKLFLLLATACTVFTFKSLPIYAANSGSQIKTVGGYTYTFYSQAISNSGSVSFSTIAFSTQTTPANYVGAYSRLYSSNGSLVKSTSWSYAATSLVTGSMFTTSDTSKCYYSKGKVGFYNGNGYSTYDCYSSPTVSPYSINGETIEIQKNSSGQIYGSEYFLNQIGIEPDLIAAIGNNGVAGYVRSNDINDEGAVDLVDAYSYNNTVCDRTIPLYDSNGEQKIDSFTIVPGNNDVGI